MIKNLTSAQITSDFFGENRELRDILSERINVVYGQNGSGKSTIADAFRDFSEGGDTRLRLPDARIDADGRKRIFVFDERFIRRNLEMSSHPNGLDTIVTIGEAVEMSHEETDLEKQKNVAQAEMESAEKKLPDIQTQIGDLKRRLEVSLKLDEGYAGLGRDIRCQKNKISVNLDDIIAVSGREGLDSVNQVSLRSEIVDGIKKLRAASEQAELHWTPSQLPVADVLPACEAARDLLARRIEKPELSDREQRILEFGEEYIRQTRSVILDAGAEICPLCHQPVTAERREDIRGIIERIEAALSDVASAYLDELRRVRARCQPGPLQIPDTVRAVFSEETGILESSHVRLCEEVRLLTEKLDARIANVLADPVDFNTALIRERCDAFTKAADSLAVKVTAHDQTVRTRNQLQSDLFTKNQTLAYLENRDSIGAYVTLTAEEERLQTQIERARDKQKEVQRGLDALRARRSNTNEARDYINSCLAYIFADKGRLELVPGNGEENGVYTLRTNGRQVSLDRVSVGERNAIALAYFFASTFKGKRVRDRYGDASLYVIDDPVSSFDQGNRAGIMEFLSKQFSSILRGNADSKILVFTHDLQSAHSLMVVRNRIEDMLFPDRDRNRGILELKNKGLVSSRTLFNGSNYHKQLCEVYRFAEDDFPSEESCDGMGNKMRQLMEAYSLFNYNSPLDYVLRNEEVLGMIPSQYRNYYRNLSARLVFNATSHSGLIVDSMEGTQQIFTPGELHRIARDLLVFIRYTDPLHLKFILRKEGNAQRVIESWSRDIPADDKAGLEAAGQAVSDIAARCEGKTFVVEQDEMGNIHCGECLLPRSASYLLGRKVRLGQIMQNTHPTTQDKYPAFARFYPQE